MPHNKNNKGWEVSREVEAQKTTIAERAKVSGEHVKRLWIYALSFIVLFIGSIWLAGNPFEFTQRLPSEYVMRHNLLGTDTWHIIWYVVILCVIFEFMDSAGGMGYGTALTPLLLLAGFDPRQVVPLIMITEAFTGLIAGLVHGEFENIEWKFRPMNETTKQMCIISVLGMAATAISISAVYGFFQVHSFWIRLYVGFLLIVMGVCSLFTARKEYPYRPRMMWTFAFVGGFNKGIGGGGYGPVITVGGLLSGIPVKSMVAITSFAEGFTCVFAVITWFALLSTGVVIDYMLLPSFVIGTVIAAIGAPYVTRIFSERFWKIVVPAYCCVLAVYAFYRLWPSIQERLLS